MNKSDEIRRKTWRMIAKNLIVLAALAVAAVIGVMSWFTQNTTATADGISVECIVPDGLEVAIVNPSLTSEELGTYLSSDANWHEGTIQLTKENYPFISDLFLCEVTGNGISFMSPVLSQTNGIAYVDEESSIGNWTVATPNIDYLSFDLYFRSENEHSVELLSSSSILPASTLSASQSAGMYSANAVVGAVRMSVVNPSSTRELLWIPAPSIYYDSKTDTLITGIQSNNTDHGTVLINDDYTFSDGTYVHGYYNTSGTRQTISSGTDFFANYNNGNYSLGNDVEISTLTQQGDYYINHVRCNIWIEGEDAEARLAMVGGKFTAELSLGLKN